MTPQKTIILTLVAAIIIMSTGIAYIGFIRSTAIDSVIDSDKDAKESTSEVYNNTNIDSIEYVRKTLKADLYEEKNLMLRQRQVLPDETSRYKSATWVRDGQSIYFQAFHTIKGEKYKRSDLSLDYDIHVRLEIAKDMSAGDRVKMLDKFFLNNNIKNAAKKEFNLKKGFKDADILEENGSKQDINTTKDVIIKDNSEVTEFVWDNPDNTIETRAIWVVDSSGDNDIVYFVACKVFKASELYSKRSCFSIDG